LTADFATQLELFRGDLDARLSRLKPSDTIRGLFINQYLVDWERRGGSALRARCLEALGEERVSDFYNYPYASLLRMGLVGVEALGESMGGVDAFLLDLGRVATRGYFDSALGKAFLGLVPLNPRAMLRLMPWAIRSTFDFGRRTMEFTGPTHGVFQCRFDFSPARCNAGAVEQAVVACGAREVRIEVDVLDTFNHDLRVSWVED
jgi:uncharacterized protein (TIGR02265 family)